MASNVNTGSTVRHAAASKIVITFQSFVILSLTYWIIEEYLNNMYLRQYVSDVFQANGLIIGILGVLLVLGPVSSLLFMRKRHGEKKFGAVSLEITGLAPKTKAVPEPSQKPVESQAKSSTDFHPVVAALRADMADRRLSFGSMLGSSTEQPTTLPPRTEIHKTSVLDQLTPTPQAPITGPRPGLTGAPVTQRPMPALHSQQPVGSNVLQNSQPPAQQMPLKITTVITGIMPAQKKKDPTAASEEKPSSN